MKRFNYIFVAILLIVVICQQYGLASHQRRLNYMQEYIKVLADQNVAVSELADNNVAAMEQAVALMRQLNQQVQADASQIKAWRLMLEPQKGVKQ